jgi:hypothetical protein
MRVRVAWGVYAVAAAALALVVLWNWIWAIFLRGPILYGEGAVAHAAILAREHGEYVLPAASFDGGPLFVAANYPPLYLHLASLGDDPFVTGRAFSVAASLLVAGAIAWRARAAGVVVAATLAVAWIASVPVMTWGAVVKPDAIALAFTVGAVVALARERPAYVLAGALLAAAALAKPTALVPALALLAYVASRDPAAALRGLGSGAVTAAMVLVVTHLPDDAMRQHVIVWNALPWRVELLLPLVVVALLVLAVPAAQVVVTRRVGGVLGAYLVGASGVLLLGGREGATINYFLDLSAALALLAADHAPRLAAGTIYPFAALAQLVVSAALINPFPNAPSVLQPTGKWGPPEHAAYVRDFVPGTVLAEDSGLLIANAREPVIDDLFLWSRSYANGHIPGAPLLDAVRAGRFDAVVSEIELERVAADTGYARQRWHPDLVAAVLERYHMPRRTFGLCKTFFLCRQLFVYTRR